MCKVSIIMPSLNVAKYIVKCMDSVVAQTLKDIEIIVIDAGSTDGTLEILQSYADRDLRICLFHSDIKSYGYQVNLGLSAAQGEYVGIVETDDWVETNAYEMLYNYAYEYKADYVRGNVECYKEAVNGMAYGNPIYIFPKEQYNINGGIIQINPQYQKEILIKDIFLWNGIYKRSFLQGIKLNETAGAAYQDVGFLAQVYCRATSGVYIDKQVYHYRKDNENSSCYSRNAFKYLVEEYEFVHMLIKYYGDEWKTLNDVRYFHQIYSRFKLMAESDIYWDKSQPYIQTMQTYFKGKNDLKSLLGEEQRLYFELFVDSPTKLYKVLREQYIKSQNKWKKFLDNLSDRDIVIFGSGKRGYFLQFLLTKTKVGRIFGYCDNNSQKIGGTVGNIKVKALDDWVKLSNNICYIVASKEYSDTITEQLLEKGIVQDNIVLFDLPRDFSIL